MVLERLSKTKHKEKFIVKGGMLIASIVGLDSRSTMDLDATIKNTPLTEANIIKIVKEICEIELDDNVIFKIISIHPIRKDDLYGGYVVRLDAIFESIITPLSIDVSCGDVITPSAIQYSFVSIFDENIKINLWGYNIETISAEKIETILNRGIFTTRPKDYYDILLDVCDGYYRVTLDTYEETIEFLCGNIGYHWIFFPQYDSGTVLGNYNNIEYNFRKLYDIFNEHDAISIARSLPEIEKYLRFQKKKEEFT